MKMNRSSAKHEYYLRKTTLSENLYSPVDRTSMYSSEGYGPRASRPASVYPLCFWSEHADFFFKHRSEFGYQHCQCLILAFSNIHSVGSWEGGLSGSAAPRGLIGFFFAAAALWFAEDFRGGKHSRLYYQLPGNGFICNFADGYRSALGVPAGAAAGAFA